MSSFQIKNFRSIAASMVNVARASQTRITDFSVGAVARTLMESPAVEIEELYLQMLLGLQDAIPVSIYQAVGFDIIDALPSSGVLTIYFATPVEPGITIPAGTLLEAPDTSVQFYVRDAVLVPDGSTQATVTVVAVKPGAAGNVAQNAISRFVNFSAFADSSIQHAALTSGRDAESDVERKTRFVALINSLSRGTLASVDYAARYATVKNTSGAVQEFVTRVGTTEYPGRVDVFIRGSAGAPSAALLAAAQKAIDGSVDYATGIRTEGYRPAGVRVTVMAATERGLPMNLTVGVFYASQKTNALTVAINAAVNRVLRAVAPGDALQVGNLVGAVLGLTGVRSCGCDVASNVVCAQSETLQAGAINITWLPNA